MIPIIAMWMLISPGATRDVDAGAIAAGVEQRIDRCRNLKFGYTVRASDRPSPEAKVGKPVPPGQIESRDVFSIMDSNRPDVSTPWWCWERQVDTSGGERVCDMFIGFDGTQGRRFARKDIGEGRWHQGNIVPFDDPYAFNLNRFEAVLLGDINGLPQRVDPTHALSHELGNHLRVTGRKEFQGRQVYLLEGQNDRYGLDYKIEISGPPDFVILRREVSGVKDRKPYFLTEVRTLKEFEGQAYPGAGLYRQWPMGETRDVTYEFNVTSIERLADSARDRWFPDWPPGTSVRDQVSNKNFDIPHDAHVLEEGRLAQLGGLAAGTRWWRMFVFLVLNIGGIALLIVAIRRSRRHRRALAEG